MFKLFGKKEKPVTVYVGDNAPLKITEKEFNRILDKFNERMKNLDARNERLERIIKYAPFDPDKVGYHLDSCMVEKEVERDLYISFTPFSRLVSKKCLYIYHNREEYAVELEELTDCIFVKDSKSIKWLNKKDSLVEFTVMTHKLDFLSSNETEHDVKKHIFTIDFKSGKYLYKCEVVEVDIHDDCMGFKVVEKG